MSAKDAYLRRMQEDAEERGTYARPAGPGSHVAERRTVMNIREELGKLASNELRALLPSVDSQGKLNAIHSILGKRQAAHERGQAAAQLLLDVCGGEAAKTLHSLAIDTATRQTESSRHLEAEQAMGVADAFWDYIRERSDV